jgi:signal transduction histidine kinase
MGAESAAVALQVSPITFKAFLSSWVDVLVEHALPAIVWAKLPRGDAWQAELERYSDLPEVSRGIYLLKNQREESVEDASEPTEPLTTLTAVPMQLAVESMLRREYFLLIWSAEFCGLLVAYRSKPAAKGEGEVEDDADKRQFLMALVSLEPTVIRSAIAQLQAHCGQTDWLPALEEFPASRHSQIAAQVLLKQVQRQEELWQRATNYRRQAEQSNLLQLQNEELLGTIRLKDEFLSNVGQELRTPLTNMKTALTLLNSPNLKPPQRQRYMDLLIKECDRQSSLISSLLDLVSLDQMAEQATMQAIQLVDVVPGVVSTYQPVAEEKGVRLAYTLAENLPPIACLNTWLKQIVINLLHNGIKFTPRGGQVWVRAKPQGDYIHLEFRDTGVGIPPQETAKIFDRFYRVRQLPEDAGGAGLGLTIVQKLLMHCGGSISVKSRLGEGSTFSVLLPIYQVQREAS